MADSKLSALTPATSVNLGDYLLLVQGGNSLKVDVLTLFGGASETLISSGAISLLMKSSKIKALTAGATYTLAAGVHGQEKTIVCNAVDVTTPTATLNITSGAGVASVVFNAIGDTVTLRNVDGLWYVVGSNGVTIA